MIQITNSITIVAPHRVAASGVTICTSADSVINRRESQLRADDVETWGQREGREFSRC
jgi:hypothetical protein